MTLSLKVPHAKALAEAAALGPFEEIVALSQLKTELEEMDRTVRTRLSRNLHTLLNVGTTWDEIESRTAISKSTLGRLAKTRA